MKLVVVYNAKSGGQLTKRTLKVLFDQAGIEVSDWIQIGRDFEQRLRVHIAGASTIAVVGGDGTQRAVAALVANTAVTMVPLPGGTLNHFTKDLDVPQNIEEAITRLPTLPPKVVDVASVNGMIFVNNSSIGVYPRSLRERQKTERSLGKWLAAAVASMRSLIWLKNYELIINGKPTRTPFVFIGNNHYDFQSTILAKRSLLTKGHLTLLTVRTLSRTAMVRAALFDRFHKKSHTRDFSITKPVEVTVESQRQMLSVSLDGEIEHISTPLHYEIKPKSLKVLV